MPISHYLMDAGSRFGRTGILLGFLSLGLIFWYVVLAIGGVIIAYYSRTPHDVAHGLPLWRRLCTRSSLLMGWGEGRTD